MNGIRNKVLASTALIGLITCVSANSQQLPANSVPISIYWSKAAGKAPLAAVAFQDENLGAIPFKLETDHFTGTRPAQGSWAFHDVSLSYGADEAPLALRTRAGVTGVRIDVALPTFASCRREKLNELKAVARNAPLATRVNAMLGARHLLALRANTCPLWAQRDLAEIYFVLNCSLATQTSYFRVAEEAKEKLRSLARNPTTAEAEIANCDKQTLGVAVKTLRDASIGTLAKGDFKAFEAINSELMMKVDEPLWGGAFVAQDLNPTLLRADLLKAIYDQQQASASRGEFDEALQYNARLTSLFADKDYAQAFKDVSLNAERLRKDREYFEALSAPQSPAPQ